MSDLHDDPTWRGEAKRVAEDLDRNDVRHAQHSLREDLWKLQDDPRAQHEFLRMVEDHDHKGMGADLVISRGPNGQESWQIAPPAYGSTMPYRPEQPPVVVMPAPRPDVVVVQPEQPSAGDRFVSGLATGAGVGIGLGITRQLFRRH